MNKKILTISGLLLFTVAGFMPPAANAQETGVTQPAVKPSVVSTETVAKNTFKVPFAPRIEKYTPPAGSVLPIVKKRAATPTTYTWTGAYVGGNFGYGWGGGDTRFEPLPNATAFINMLPVTIKADPRGFTVGGHGGYNWQSGHFVAGPEASISWSNIKRTTTVSPIIQNNGTAFGTGSFQSTTQDIDYVGTFRGRAGGAWNRVYLYGTAGLAFGRLNYAAESDFRPTGTLHYPAAFTKTKAGWAAGFGGEVAVNDHWSWKTDYLYFDFGNESLTVPSAPTTSAFSVMYNWKTTFHSFNTGFNYRW